MLNNKGFVVSAILYTLLMVFLLFLGILLSKFSSSIDIISNANNDLVNGNHLIANQILEKYDINDLANDGTIDALELSCIKSSSINEKGYKWYERYEKDDLGKVKVPLNKISSVKNALVKINSRYGTFYWPKDFTDGINQKLKLTCTATNENVIDENCNVIDLGNLKDDESYGYAKIEMLIEDTELSKKIKIIIGDVCR